MKLVLPQWALHNAMWVLEQGYSSSSDAVRASSLPAEIQIHPKCMRLDEAPLATLATKEQNRKAPKVSSQKQKEEVDSKLNGMNV